MEDNKTTFGPDEKDTLETLALFEQELSERLEESKSEIERVKYYEKFKINGINFANMFITTEKDVDGNISYHIYCGDSSNEIIYIDSEGKVQIKNSELQKYISDMDFDLEKLMEENEQDPEKLKGISEKAEPEEMEKALDREAAEKDDSDVQEQDEATQEIEEDLKEHGEDLEISKYRKIKDSHIHERMPEVFENGQESGIAFSNKLNRFVIISKENGQYQINDNVEPGRMTWKTIISIDPSGEKVERKVPYALMKLPNNQEKEIAVTLDQYGTPSIETVDVLPCQERIARAVREQGEDSDKEESLKMREQFKKQGKEYPHKMAHKTEKLEREYNVTETGMEELKELDIEAIMEVEAKKAKVSKEDFKKYVRNAYGRTLQEKIDNAHEEIEQEYMHGKRPR